MYTSNYNIIYDVSLYFYECVRLAHLNAIFWVNIINKGFQNKTDKTFK